MIRVGALDGDTFTIVLLYLSNPWVRGTLLFGSLVRGTLGMTHVSATTTTEARLFI